MTAGLREPQRQALTDQVSRLNHIHPVKGQQAALVMVRTMNVQGQAPHAAQAHTREQTRFEIRGQNARHGNAVRHGANLVEHLTPRQSTCLTRTLGADHREVQVIPNGNHVAGFTLPDVVQPRAPWAEVRPLHEIRMLTEGALAADLGHRCALAFQWCAASGAKPFGRFSFQPVIRAFCRVPEQQRRSAGRIIHE